MTTRPAGAASSPTGGFVRLPDPPEPEDMNNHLYLNAQGNALHLARHFSSEDTTLIIAGVYISRKPTGSRQGLFEPDLIIAFGVAPEVCVTRNGYVISEQGKPPDFVLEIGSRSTGRRDVTVKRDGYSALGIPEYWRFDPSGGDYHGAPLAGDRLESGYYQPIPVERIDDGRFQGYSAVLDLYLRWEDGQLGWYDPATGQHIIRFDDERERADAERGRADAEQAARVAAEARVRELESELERRRNLG